MRRAGEYLSTLTCGAFTSLAVDDIDDQRVLRAVRSSTGEHLAIDELSDGTRDPLYLALRLAYIEAQCETVPCPVILDDVLMAFDNDRAAAALRALQELSCRTQVLVFTHHEHHLALAKHEFGPAGFSLHELTAAALAVVQSA